MTNEQIASVQQMCVRIARRWADFQDRDEITMTGDELSEIVNATISAGNVIEYVVRRGVEVEQNLIRVMGAKNAENGCERVPGGAVDGGSGGPDCNVCGDGGGDGSTDHCGQP